MENDNMMFVLFAGTAHIQMYMLENANSTDALYGCIMNYAKVLLSA